MITEDQLEQLCLEWFQSTGYDYVCGYDIAPDADPSSGRGAPERSDYRQIILHERLLERLHVINPHIPADTLELVAQQIAKPETPILIKNNMAFHQLLQEGIKVNFKENGKDKHDYVHLVDFSNISNNQFLVVNQYTISGSKGNRILKWIGMTDEYATRFYERIFYPRKGSMFERL